MDKIAVLIPCYNESQTIAKVVADWKAALPEATIYVYDNNSKDGTAEMAAVFMMEPTLTRTRRYINGGGTVRGACTVSVRVREYDGAKRHETAAFFAALAAYVRECGTRYEDGGEVYVVRPAANPARLHLQADGAVWELRCSVEVYEK